jgi:heme A synthase
MLNLLFKAHSGLRYLVLFMGLVALVYFAFGLATRRPVDKKVRILGSSFAGLLDTQILLGIILVGAGWPFRPMVWGHLALMLLAAGLAHALLVINRKRPQPGFLLPLIAVGGALVLILGGILAIGRSPMASTLLGG